MTSESLPIDEPGSGPASPDASAHALEPVPQSERKTWWSITLLMIAVGMDLAGLLLGLELAKGLGLWAAVAAVLLGSTLLGLLGIVCSVVGARTGLSSAMIAASAFGREGARLVALLTGLSMLGWFAVQAGFLGNNLASALTLLGIHAPAAPLSACGGLLMTWTAIYGYRAMERLSRWTVPLMALLIGTALVLELSRLGTAQAMPAAQPMNFFAATSFVVGTFIAGVSTFPDFSRYARSTKDAVFGAFFGFLIGNSVTLIIAVVLAKFTGEADLIRLFASLHMSLAAVVVFVFAQWTGNTSNLYSAGLAFSVVGRGAGISNTHYVIGLGLIGTALALAGIADAFLGFLLILSMLIAPIGGAYSGRYFIVLQGRFPDRPERYVGSSLLAWACGSTAAWASTPHDPGAGLYGLGLVSLTTIPPVDGFLVAFLTACLPAFAGRPRQPSC
jgi:cytosine permease